MRRDKFVVASRESGCLELDPVKILRRTDVHPIRLRSADFERETLGLAPSEITAVAAKRIAQPDDVLFEMLDECGRGLGLMGRFKAQLACDRGLRTRWPLEEVINAAMELHERVSFLEREAGVRGAGRAPLLGDGPAPFDEGTRLAFCTIDRGKVDACGTTGRPWNGGFIVPLRPHQITPADVTLCLDAGEFGQEEALFTPPQLDRELRRRLALEKHDYEGTIERLRLRLVALLGEALARRPRSMELRRARARHVARIRRRRGVISADDLRAVRHLAILHRVEPVAKAAARALRG